MKYILGGGISGLIAAHYLEDHTIITDKIGGQLAAEFPLGPRYVKVTPQTTELFTRLGLSLEVKSMNVGYRWKGKLYREPTRAMQEAYCLKTRNKPLEKEAVMNEGLSKMMVFKHGDDLVPALIDSVKDRIQQGIRVTSPRELCEVKVSTIPLPTMYKILGIPHKIKELEYRATLFIFYYHKALWDEMAEEAMSFIYLCDPEDRYYRATMSMDPNSTGGIILETHRGGEILQVEDMEQVKHVFLPIGRIISGDRVDQLKIGDIASVQKIEHIGRYAQWNPSIRISDVIRRVKDVRDVRN